MSETPRSITQKYARLRDSRLGGIHATIRFDVEGVSSWSLRIDDGGVELSESKATVPADLVVTCDEAAFVALLEGDLRLLTAVLRGDVGVEGDLSLGLRFHGLRPATDSAAKELGAP